MNKKIIIYSRLEEVREAYPIGTKIYWCSWDGKHKGEYTIQGYSQPSTNCNVKIQVQERKKPIPSEYILDIADRINQFYLYEGRRYYNNEKSRNCDINHIFEQ